MSRQLSQRGAKPHFKLKKKVKTNILLSCKVNKNNLSLFSFHHFKFQGKFVKTNDTHHLKFQLLHLTPSDTLVD